MHLAQSISHSRKLRASAIAASVAFAIISASTLAAPAAVASAQPFAFEPDPAPAPPGEIVTVTPQGDGITVISVQEAHEPVETVDSAAGTTYDQVIETTIYVDTPEAEATSAPSASGGGTRGGILGSGIAKFDSKSSGANDSTSSVNVWVNLNYTVVSSGVIRANTWQSRYTRLDPAVTFLGGGVTHRNDRVPYSGTQSYSGITSGHTYSFTPSYAGFNTLSTSANGIYGQAFLNWKIYGSTYTSWSGSVHPF